MKHILKRGLSFILAVIMVAGLLPVSALAAVDSTGRPKDVNNTLILSIYTGSGFPGEPAVYGTGNYKNINSSFAVRSGATFASSASAQLDWAKIQNDIVQGPTSGSTTVWGVYNANGTKDYFLSDASIIQPANEAKMIRAVKSGLNNVSDADVLNQYEIIWYVIKLQHNPGSGWFSRATTEWHIDGIVKEREKVSINYYGNGNTSGAAPLGIATHTAGNAYTILNQNTLVKKINGVEVAFLGWSAKADGTGAEAGFYQPGDVIYPTESISLYAMWDTTTQYTATVNTYLDGKLTAASAIHDTSRALSLSTDNTHFYDLTESTAGVYTAKITGNGKFHLYTKNPDGTYTQIGDYQLTIYNQNASLDVHHYSVTYDPNGGAFATDPGSEAYLYGSSVTAISEEPAREGYRFLGWKDSAGNLIHAGQEVTASITAPMTLTAQWEKTVNVTVNVTINHAGGDGYDQMDSRNDIVMDLVSRADATSSYLETGDSLTLSDSAHTGFAFTEENNVTKYTATGPNFTDMPGGTAEYTVVTSKSGYDTSVTAKQDKNGDWIIDVEMVYNPTNFDLDFTVEVDPSVPDRYLPTAAIVKVTFWASDRNRWEIITQQEGSAPGVRVNIDPETRSGSGSYPVWKYESASSTPYGYRIEVTSFVYPDGTIVPASTVLAQDVQWTDQVYIATMDDVTGGQVYGTLDGAYFADDSDTQKGTLNAVITMDLHNVTFDAQGGKVNGQDSQTVKEQYHIPAFRDYIPVREGGYTFGGWYLDAGCTTPATEGADLTENITLYAKWIDPLTISGTVTISGTYWQDGELVSVHDIDRATEAVVVLQQLQNGTAVEVDSKTVSFGTYENSGTADYSFTGIPNDGKTYQIHVLVLNYTTTYDNESDKNTTFTAGEYAAVFGNDTVADVDAQLTFAPPSYDQKMIVDTTAIAKTFRPREVLTEVMYRDAGDNHPFQRISQHDVAPYGVYISTGKETGLGESSQSVWNWHTDGTLYDYQMNITKVDGVAYNADTAPFYITYTEAKNATANSGDLRATLIPKQYLITFDLNAGEDTVTGMDAYKVEEAGTDGESATISYKTYHTWSYDTTLNAVPQREGYTFLGWQTTVTGASGTKIDAEVHEDVTLTALWEQITYEVTTVATPAEGGTVSGAGTYPHSSDVTIHVDTNAGYTFLGWYENDELVTNEPSYSFTAEGNRDFTAKFSLNQHTVTTSSSPMAGGITEGDGTYDYGTEVTVSAAANPGYTFIGWYQDNDLISSEESFRVTVTENLSYTAKFKLNQHTVTTEASPAEGGTVSGAGTYYYGSRVTVNAETETGYTFIGWFENDVLVSEDAKYSFTVAGDHALVAKFEENIYTVTANAERGGTAEGTATYRYGETATVTAITEPTFTFGGWYEGDTKVSDNPSYSFTVTSDRTLTAKFTKNGYQVTALTTVGGTANGSGYYEEGETATVTATAAEGYAFRGWYEGDTKVSDSPSYSFTVTSDRTLTAQFAQVYTITTIAQTGGAVTGGGQYEPMTNATITATPYVNYYFVGWYDENNELVTADTSYSLSVKEDRTFTAKFEQKVSYTCDYVYIFGYQDTQIGAEGPLLRGELSQMIYRLVKQKYPGTSTGGHSFSDTSGEWFQTGVSYMASVGAIDSTQSNAYPFASVTRGETYKMICLGLGFTRDTSLSFSEYATILRNSGYISGDGAVTARIARYEFCALFNAILGRTNYQLIDTDGNEVTAETYGYTDLDPSKPYYRTMLIATSTFNNQGRVDLAARAKRNVLDNYG